MAKPVISPEEVIAEVNGRIPSHPAYAQGMHAFLVLRGSDSKTASGYDWEPDGLATTGVVQPPRNRSKRSLTLIHTFPARLIADSQVLRFLERRTGDRRGR